MKNQIAIAAAVLGTLSSATASATYSVAAVDLSSGQVGGAGASCVGESGVSRIYGATPGVGVVHAQAAMNRFGLNEAVQMLATGASSAQVLDRVTAGDFDPGFATRQYAVVTLATGAATFTGDEAAPFANDWSGSVGSFTYALAGNILTSEDVLLQTEQGFTADSCDLAERLMRGLEAGREAGEGDSRCTPRGVPADAAFIQVELPDREVGAYLSLDVRGTGARDPVALLREEFNVWRGVHPCPLPTPPDAGVDSAAADAGSAPADAGLPRDVAPRASSGCGTRPSGSKAPWATLSWAVLSYLFAKKRRRGMQSRQ